MSRYAPNIFNAYHLLEGNERAWGAQCGLKDGRYVPCRPINGWGWPQRIKAAWMVFSGEADALIWPGQEH